MTSISKKITFLVSFLLFFWVHLQAYDERPITISELPENAQTVVRNYFNIDSILYVEKEKTVGGFEYKVKFIDGKTLEFDDKGEVIDMDWKSMPIPNGLVPNAILAYVREHFANSKIVELEKGSREWVVTLESDIELIFNSNFEFLRMDD